MVGQSSDSNISADFFEEELASDLVSSDDDEIPFARHGPAVNPDPEEAALHRDFWNSYAISFILDYRKFSIRHLQHIIDSAWRIKGPISIVGRVLFLYFSL